MAGHSLDSECGINLLHFKQEDLAPPPIRQLEEEITRRMKIAEWRNQLTGRIDVDEMRGIIALKIKLDDLLEQWAK